MSKRVVMWREAPDAIHLADLTKIRFMTAGASGEKEI